MSLPRMIACRVTSVLASRDVVLTESDLDGRGQVRHEPKGSGPAEASARGKQGLDYAEAGERGTEGHRAPNRRLLERMRKNAGRTVGMRHHTMVDVHVAGLWA